MAISISFVQAVNFGPEGPVMGYLVAAEILSIGGAAGAITV